jgi:hypothetical protein
VYSSPGSKSDNSLQDLLLNENCVFLPSVFYTVFVITFFYSTFFIFIMNIYFGNLSYKVRENDLQGVVAEYGEVTSCKVIKDRETGKSKGFAFVEMADDAAAKKAIEELNGAEFDGRALVVKEANPRT